MNPSTLPFERSSPMRVEGTCHLHGDYTCGKINKTGTDGFVYPGRLQCTSCGQVYCRNGLWKKFGEIVEGNDCTRWVCRLCKGTCCCCFSDFCQAQVPDFVEHSHCHNFRSAYGQRRKRKMKRLMKEIEATESHVSTSPKALTETPKKAQVTRQESLKSFIRICSSPHKLDLENQELAQDILLVVQDEALVNRLREVLEVYGNLSTNDAIVSSESKHLPANVEKHQEVNTQMSVGNENNGWVANQRKKLRLEDILS